MRIKMSQRFGKRMIHLLDVPGYSGVRVHTGNTSHHTMIPDAVRQISDTILNANPQPVSKRFYCWGCQQPRKSEDRRMKGSSVRCVVCVGKS